LGGGERSADATTGQRDIPERQLDKLYWASVAERQRALPP